MHWAACLLAVLATADVPFPDWRSEMLGDRPLPASVGKRLTAGELAAVSKDKPVTPYADLTAGIRAADGTLWVASARGLMQLAPGQERWRLFHSRRWLPDDRVLDLALAADGSVWVRTPAGTGRLFQRPMTLEAKVAEVHAALRKHHVWKGLVKEIVLNRPGDVAGGYAQPSSDNDGLWTSLYVAAEAFRYGATGDPLARRNAWESLQALMFLEQVTGIPGFAARSFVPRDVADPAKTYGGEWHPSVDGRWWWKGDTSSDEVVGHYFAYAVYYDVAADEDQRREIRPFVARITDHIIDHGYYYVGPPGKPTTWGVWAPEQLNRNLRRAGDRGLNSLELLSLLKVAEQITGRPRYAAAARELDERHGYAINTLLQKTDWPAEMVNHSDDELAFLAYYPLLWYERDERLRAIYLLSLERSWQIERPEGSPLWNFIYASGLQASQWKNPCQRPPEAFVKPERYDGTVCLEWFRDVPTDTVRWAVRNSDRRDLIGRAKNRFRHSRALEVLPISERMMLRWNADPYELDDSSDGRERGDGVFVLLPYWLGRYHRLID
jgi:hypothetical protein